MIDDRLPYKRGPLYNLLAERFPDYRTGQGVFDVPRLAKDMNMTPAGVYKWFDEDRISVKGVKKVVALSGREDNREAAKVLGFEPLTPQDFLSIIFA